MTKRSTFKPGVVRRLFLYGAVVCAVVILGSVGTISIQKRARQAIQKEAASDADSLATSIEEFLQGAVRAAQLLGESSLVSFALTSPDSIDLDLVNVLLDRYQKTLKNSVCYLLNEQGVTVASSNRRSPVSFVGKDYSFRPYYKEALEGRAARYYALGVTSGKRGFYASFPVRDDVGHIVGVAVVKQEVDGLEAYLRAYHPAFIASEEGVIFLASDQQFLFKTLLPLPQKTQEILIASKQFGPGPFKPLFEEPIRNALSLQLEGQPFTNAQQLLGKSAWRVINLYPLSVLEGYRLAGIVITVLICVVFTVLFAVFFLMRDHHKRLEKEQQQWQRTFDAIADMIFIQDKDFTITRVNHSFAQALKMKPEALVGKKCFEIMHKSDHPWENCPFKKTREDHQVHVEEVDDPRIGIPLLVTTSPIFDAKGEFSGSVHVACDISLRREAERMLQRKMRDLELFHRAAVGREMKMLELKKEIAFLQEQLQKAREKKE